ncbi:MAG: ribonuclease P protein component [Muribaculaceae bacterium]|nr:ribonuclease P protein component [Muribaculaceae bacterium]
MNSLRLYKKEKLRSLTAIERLFSPRSVSSDSPVASVMAYPWRVVWSVNPHRPEVAQFLISVPKKRLRHAVDRVQMRRRCREAYRLSRHLLPSPCPGIDIAFIYVADTVTPYPKTLRAMTKMLSSITQAVSPDENAC